MWGKTRVEKRCGSVFLTAHETGVSVDDSGCPNRKEYVSRGEIYSSNDELDLYIYKETSEICYRNGRTRTNRKRCFRTLNRRGTEEILKKNQWPFQSVLGIFDIFFLSVLVGCLP